MALAAVSLDDKYTQDEGRIFVTAMQALTRLPLEQRRRDVLAGLNTGGYISGYRGSPLGGLDKSLWAARKHLEDNHIRFQPGVNEDLAATAIWGTQQVKVFPGARYDGVFSMWYGKGPGVERAGDALHHGNFVGSSEHGGVLLAVGDDPVCHSSTIPQQSDVALMASFIPVLNAADVQDIYDLGLIGWQLSRFSGSWIALRMVSDVAESSAGIALDPLRTRMTLPEIELPPGGLNQRYPDWATDQHERVVQYRLPAVVAFARANRLDRVTLESPRPRLGIVTTGKSHGDVRQALRDLGLSDAEAASIGVSVYKVVLAWPLDTESLRDFAEGLDELLVIEEGRAVLEPQIKEALYGVPDPRRPRVLGKHDEQGAPLLKGYGEFNPAELAPALAARIQALQPNERLAERLRRIEADREAARSYQPSFARTPYFCSGCPHNTGTRVPEGSTAMGGIGCHFMAVRMDRSTHTWTHMGAEGVTWVGMEPFTDMPHMFVNLGDGTYYHSGFLAIRAAVAANSNITYKLLYNDAVAMTGGQPVDGPISVQQIAQQVHAEGVRHIALVSDGPEKYSSSDFPAGTTIDHRDDYEAVQRDLRERQGVSLLIYEQTCATEKRRRRKRGKLEDPAKRVVINERVCEGCGDCSVQSNCLSVLPLETEFGRKRTIDQSACNKDFSCLKGFCPSFVTVHGGAPRKPQGATPDEAQFATLPRPTQPDTREPYSMLVAGIGGMGVVTVSALLGTAAQIEGKVARVIDDTGLAQKFGAVYSHVQIADDDAALHTARIGQGNANLILGPDLVTAASEKVMGLARRGGTHAVVNTHEQMTGAFTKNPDLQIPSDDLKTSIREFCGEGRAEFVDASRLARDLLGDTIGANMFMLGYACQNGLVPLTPDSIEAAIRLNGTFVEGNLNIFRWGRLYASERERVEAVVGGQRARQAKRRFSQSLAELREMRYRDLVDYQNAAYADGYAALVDRVQQAEKEHAPGRNGLTEAVAKYYYKLLAYKDEYEVARLYTNGEYERQVKEQFAGEYKLHFHLAPPMLARRDPVTGHLHKREFGPWILPALRVVARLRGLRGTAFDPFGYTAERRMERRLIGEYETVVEELIANLNAENHALAVEIASMPEQIRGYGHVKERHLEQAKADEAELLRRFRLPEVERSAA